MLGKLGGTLIPPIFWNLALFVVIGVILGRSSVGLFISRQDSCNIYSPLILVRYENKESAKWRQRILPIRPKEPIRRSFGNSMGSESLVVFASSLFQLDKQSMGINCPYVLQGVRNCILPTHCASFSLGSLYFSIRESKLDFVTVS